jgi:molybdate/tungstate transport system substrate-binding protein
VLADSFRVTTGIPLRVELGGSLELSRRTTDLGTPPDVLLLADDVVMAALMPAHLDWYVRFATSSLVVAHGDRARGVDSISPENWWRILSAEGVTIGRADSAIAPAGRHALGVLRRAEAYYGQRGLTQQLLSRSGPRLVRPNATELAALLDAGQVDFILEYESVARQFGFRYVKLPADLAPAVLYGAGVPKASSRAEDAVRFVVYLLGPDGERIMRAAHVDVLRTPVVIGRNIPVEVSSLGRTVVSR